MNKIIRNIAKVAQKAQENWVDGWMSTDNLIAVVSSTSDRYYTVRIVRNEDGRAVAGICNCAWGMWRPVNDHRSACSHSQTAMAYVIKDENDRKVKAHGDLDQARKTHRKIINIGDGVIFTARKVGC